MQCESKKHQGEAAFDLHTAYQDWVQTQDFYPTLLANRGTALFLRDGDEYRYMPIRVGFKAYQMIQDNRGTI